MTDRFPVTFEGLQLAAISFDEHQGLVTVERLPGTKAYVAKIFQALAKEKISLDLIVQNVNSEHTFLDLSFSVNAGDAERVTEIVHGIVDGSPEATVKVNLDVAKVSLEGMGMRTHALFASRMFETLGQTGVNILLISTSEMKISCYIPIGQLARAIASLSEALRLSITREEVQHKDGSGDADILLGLY